MRRNIRWSARARWVALAAVGAGLPVIVAAGRALRRGWLPLWDNAYPALRAWDVFTSDPPLLGTRSRAGDFGSDLTTNHPGPFEFEVLAPWVRLLGVSDGTVVGMAVLNLACIAVVAWLCSRRAGALGATVGLAAMAGLTWSMGSEMLFDPWPPFAGLFPFAAFLVAAWSASEGDGVALPVMAVAGSFALQVHVGYVVLVVGIAAVTVVVAFWRTRRRDARDDWRPTARWLLVAGGVGLVCWVPPLYEEVRGNPGNLTSLWHAVGAQESTHIPMGRTVDLVGSILALPPWWLPPSFRPSVQGFTNYGGLLPELALVALCALLVVLARRASHRKDSVVAGGLLVMLATIPLTLLSVNRAPEAVGFTTMYLRFVWVVAAAVSVVVVLALVEEMRTRDVPARLRRWSLAAPATAAAVAGLLALPYVDHAHTTPPGAIAITDDLAAEVVPELRGRGPVLVRLTSGFSSAQWVGPGLMVKLQEAGIPFVVDDPELRRQLGRRRSNASQAEVELIVWGRRGLPPDPDARLIAETEGMSERGRAKQRELQQDLRRAAEHVRGVPIAAGWEDGLSDDTAAAARPIIEDMAAVDDVDELLATPRFVELLTMWVYMFGELDGLVAADGFPVDVLERWFDVKRSEGTGYVAVYLVPT